MPGGLSEPAQDSLKVDTAVPDSISKEVVSPGGSGYATPVGDDQPPAQQSPTDQKSSPSAVPSSDENFEPPKEVAPESDADKPVSEEPVTLKLRASLRKRKSQEAARAQMSQPDPLDLFGQVNLPSASITCFPGPSYESAAMTKLVLTENQCVLLYLKHLSQSIIN